mgnify:CR=1 FL=1
MEGGKIFQSAVIDPIAYARSSRPLFQFQPYLLFDKAVDRDNIDPLYRRFLFVLLTSSVSRSPWTSYDDAVCRGGPNSLILNELRTLLLS